MSIRRARAFVFDFDGTLAPNLDLPAMRQQVIEQTRAAGVPPSVYDGLYIIEIIEAARDWLAAHGQQHADVYFEGAHAHITAFELEAASRLEAFPEARALLTALRRDRRRSAVVTRNCEAAVRSTFPDVDEHLDVLLARDNVRHVKPDPRHLSTALEHLDARGSEAVMVGDGAMDMELGSMLGLYCVGVLTGSNGAAALKAAGADLVLDHVGELAPLL